MQTLRQDGPVQDGPVEQTMNQFQKYVLSAGVSTVLALLFAWACSETFSTLTFFAVVCGILSLTSIATGVVVSILLYLNGPDRNGRRRY